MGTYFYPEYEEIEQDETVYFKRNILLSASAVSEATASTYTTGTGDLATTQDGSTAFPQLNALPMIKITPKQDIDVRIKRSSESLSNGYVTFLVYASGTGIDRSSGDIYFDVEFTPV
jgi:hypothetical protein